ncbi:photosystem I iron-sulfur center [Striga asiatica]|uniref:Photosystem I iron-sulfur center n=1 Tax=Striga asiatica TaxID=4170 RepID=A0A5A7Q5I2_STRAF|nr:photosystem I iron-sulfur center [Striga asiatica]
MQHDEGHSMHLHPQDMGDADSAIDRLWQKEKVQNHALFDFYGLLIETILSCDHNVFLVLSSGLGPSECCFAGPKQAGEGWAHLSIGWITPKSVAGLPWSTGLAHSWTGLETSGRTQCVRACPTDVLKMIPWTGVKLNKLLLLQGLRTGNRARSETPIWAFSIF